MTPINYLHPLLTFILLSYPTPFIDAADKQQHLNIVRDAQNIYLDIGLNENCDLDQGWLLICYPNKMLNFNGNAKASRRSQLVDQQGSENFAQCRNLTNGPHNGLRINFQGQELKMETSFGSNFSCTMTDRKFGIQLRDGASLMSSLRGCADEAPCKDVIKLGDIFNQTIWEAMVPYVDDFWPFWYLTRDMLAPNASKIDDIIYFPHECPALNFKFTNVTTTLNCGQKKPIGLKELKKPNKTKPGHVFEFGFNILDITCNQTQIKEQKMKHMEKLKYGLPENLTAFERESWLIDNRGCFNAQKHKTCNQWNSAIMTLCYDGILDPSQNVEQRFELSNLPAKEISAFCQKHQSKDKANVTRHGITIGVCSRRIKYKKEKDGTRFAMKYKVIFNVSLSYSEKIYRYTKTAWINGTIESDGFQKKDGIMKTYQNLSIHIANGTSLFVSLVDPKGKVHKFANRIESKLRKKNFSPKFNKIANEDYTLGLLGRDLISQDDKDTNWNQKMQLFSPPELCGHLKLFIDGEYDPKRLSCYKRARNLCDEMGKKDFDELIAKNHELRWLEDNCPCDSILPPETEEIATHSSIKRPYPNPKLERKKRPEKSDNDKLLIMGCEDAHEKMQQFWSEMKFPPRVDKEIEEQKKCCSNKSNKIADNNHHKRQKRQLDRSATLWKTPIAYQFDPNLDSLISKYEWKEAVRDSLDQISDLTCVHFYENFTADSDSPHLYFYSGSDGCYNDYIGFNENRHYIGFAEHCFDDEKSAEGVHELMHALGFYNEHLREDRDNYVWINGKLILKLDLRHEFKKGKTAQRELPYDFGSVMHAPAFIKGHSEYAIISLDVAYQQSMRREGGLSFKDAKSVNFFYCTTRYPYHFEDPSVTRCEIGTSKWDSCKNGGYLDPVQKCEKCRCPRGYAGEHCTDLEESDDECGTKLELTATSNWKILEFTADKKAEKCIWRIRENTQEIKKPFRVSNTHFLIEFINNGFKCAIPCEEWLEVKHKADKTANGAHICCNFGDKMPSLKAEDHATEVLLILNNPKKNASFQLKYKTGQPSIKPGNNCGVPMKIYTGYEYDDFNCFGLDAVVQKQCHYLHINRTLIKCMVGGYRSHLNQCDNVTGDVFFSCEWDNDIEVTGDAIERNRNCTSEDQKNWFDFPKFSGGYPICESCTFEEIEKDDRCHEGLVLWCLNIDGAGEHRYWKNEDGDLFRVNGIRCKRGGRKYEQWRLREYGGTSTASSTANPL